MPILAQIPELRDACEGIDHGHPRVHCLECKDYDLCMRCHSTGNVSKDPCHQPFHPHEVIHSPWTEYQNPQASPLIPSHESPQPTEKSSPNTSSLQLDSEAARYWGTIRNADGTASPMFARLCTAIFNHLDATVDPTNTNLMEPSKLAAFSEAMGFFGDDNIVHEPQNAVLESSGTIDEADELIKVLWTAREMNYVMTTRQSENPVWYGMPALTRESFLALQMVELGRAPEPYCGYTNILFKGIPELVDPVTGKGFEHRIPLNCFPLELVPEAMATIERYNERVHMVASAWWRKWNEQRNQETEQENQETEQENQETGQENQETEQENQETEQENQETEQNNQEREHSEALAIMQLGHSQALAMQTMNMMHSQRMAALSIAYQSPPIMGYIR